MSPRRRRATVLDANEESDTAVEATPDALRASDPPQAGGAPTSPSIEEATAAALAAETRAEAARARADELRRQATEAGLDERRSRRRSRRRAVLKWVAVAAAMVLICASLTVTGVMMWHHRDVQQQRQREAEFAAAARQSVVTMMALDPAKVRQSIQRVVDNSTGKLKRGLQAGAADEIARGVEQSKVSTQLTVQLVAVKAIHGDSAEVLVAATGEGTAPDNKKLPPASWRISVTVERDGGQLKISEFEFVQ
jgi:Mce-associated membrane protein